MSFTTVSIRWEVARRFKAAKAPGESYSDTLERLLDNQPAKTAGEWRCGDFDAEQYDAERAARYARRDGFY